MLYGNIYQKRMVCEHLHLQGVEIQMKCKQMIQALRSEKYRIITIVGLLAVEIKVAMNVNKAQKLPDRSPVQETP